MCRNVDCQAVLLLQETDSTALSNAEKSDRREKPNDRGAMKDRLQSTKDIYDNLPINNKRRGINKHWEGGTGTHGSCILSLGFPSNSGDVDARRLICDIVAKLSSQKRDRMSMTRPTYIERASSFPLHCVRIVEPRQRLGKFIFDVNIGHDSGLVRIIVNAYTRDVNVFLGQLDFWPLTLICLPFLIFTSNDPGVYDGYVQRLKGTVRQVLSEHGIPDHIVTYTT